MKYLLVLTILLASTLAYFLTIKDDAEIYDEYRSNIKNLKPTTKYQFKLSSIKINKRGDLIGRFAFRHNQKQYVSITGQGNGLSSNSFTIYSHDILDLGNDQKKLNDDQICLPMPLDPVSSDKNYVLIANINELKNKTGKFKLSICGFSSEPFDLINGDINKAIQTNTFRASPLQNNIK